MRKSDSENDWAAIFYRRPVAFRELKALLLDVTGDELFEPVYILLLLSFEIAPELL